MGPPKTCDGRERRPSWFCGPFPPSAASAISCCTCTERADAHVNGPPMTRAGRLVQTALLAFAVSLSLPTQRRWLPPP